MHEDPSYKENCFTTQSQHRDKFVCRCYMVINFTVKVLAVLMTFVILWGALDVVWVLYKRMSKNELFLLEISDILATFGAFIAVLIAIEIFENIIMYLDKKYIQIRLVLATALMAAARKVIVLDFNEISSDYIISLSLIIISLGITYWLVSTNSTPNNFKHNQSEIKEKQTK